MVKPLALVLSAVLIVAAASPGHAALIINTPRTITHELKVQLIQTAASIGTPVANAFGNASRREQIQNRINRVWSQAGIRVRFMDDIHRLNDTRALLGAASLADVLDTADEAGLLSPDPLTLNLAFTNYVPGHPYPTGESAYNPGSSRGTARLGNNGVVQFVGSNLLTFQNGWDVIAKVTAHEIAHNLGLQHVADNTNNLMSPVKNPAYTYKAQLTDSQINQALTSRFVQQLAEVQTDLNGDGRVDALDFTVWREGLAAGLYPAEWYQDLLNSYGAQSTPAPVQAPEPAAAMLLLWGLLLRPGRRSQRGV